MKKFLRYGLLLVAILLVAIQFVPVDKSNPPITREVVWNSAETRALAERTCYDCHSNEVKWPWYANIAPISWRIADHVRHGREHLNFSTWDQPNEDADKILEVTKSGEMPLSDYLLMHPEAQLSDEEFSLLLNGFIATFAQDPPVEYD